MEDYNDVINARYTKMSERISARNKAVGNTHLKCNNCRRLLEIKFFGKWSRGKYGYKTQCKECIKEYQDKNKDATAERMRKYRQTERYRISQREYSHRRREKILSTIDGSIPEKRYNMTDSLIELMAKQNNKCVMCSCEINIDSAHLDHIHPLSKGGTHTLDNVQWLCPTCNCSKGSKIL